MVSRIEKAYEQPLKMMIKSKKWDGKIGDCPMMYFIYLNPDENESDFSYVLPSYMTSPREAMVLGLSVGRIIIEKNLSRLKRDLLIKKICNKYNKNFDNMIVGKVKPFDPIAFIHIGEALIKEIPDGSDVFKNYQYGDLSKDATAIECFQITYKEIDKPVKSTTLPFVVRDDEIIFIDDERYKVKDVEMTEGLLPHLIENISNLGSVLDHIYNGPLS